MTKQELIKHAADFLKGLAAACAVAIITTSAQYIGAHIPELLAFLAQMGAATAAVKGNK